MSSSIFNFTGPSLAAFWNAENTRRTQDHHTVMSSALVWSVGDNLHVNWQGWAIVEEDDGFFARLDLFRRGNHLPHPMHIVSHDESRQVQRFQFAEWEGPYFYAIPQDIFKALVALPMPPTWAPARVERAIRWRAKVQEFIDKGTDRARL